MRVLNFGSLNMDYTFKVDHFVQAGETMSARSMRINAGGKGLNQSVALAKAGAETYHAGCVGEGGQMLVDLLQEAGVDTTHIMPVDEPQGNAIIQVNTHGQNCIIIYGGSNRCVTKEQVASTFENFGEGDYLLLQNEINCLTEIVDAAAERGMVICLNPSPYDDRLNGVDLSKVSLLIVNEVEAAGIAGVSDPESVWEVLHARYPEMALVETLGELGSVAFSGDIRVDQAAFTCEAVDTTGAGDTFTGYLIARMMGGCSLEEGMAWASVASGIAVTRPGAAASIPTSDEVEAML